MRAVLGQQVTLEAARRLCGQLVALCGQRLLVPGLPQLSMLFPDARVAAADLSSLGMPSARRRTLKALATAALADPLIFHAFGSIEAAVARLRSIRGVGDWTAQYIALRAL